MLIAILMSLNIVSVGYATWAITGPSNDTTEGGFVSYPVIKSDDYYTLTTAINFQGYFNNGSQGYFILTDEKGTLLENATEAQAKTGTITLTYTKKETLTNPTITTTIVFGEAGKGKSSALFFEVAQVSSVTGGDSTDWSRGENGVLTVTFEPTGEETTIKITLQIPDYKVNPTYAKFPEELKTGMYAFTFNTTVQGTPAN